MLEKPVFIYGDGLFYFVLKNKNKIKHSSRIRV
jgi:hypothetical protein